jgi:hypothetical protein
LLFLKTEDYFMKTIKLWAATAALTVSSIAVAGPSYTYVDLGFITADSQGKEDTGGFALRGSFGFADLFHVGATIDSGEISGGRSKVSADNLQGADFDAYSLYFGVNPAMTDNVDLVVRVGYDAGEKKSKDLITDVNNKRENEALFLSFGTRAMLSEKFELNAFATYSAGDSQLKDSDEAKFDIANWSYTVGGEYYFTEMFSVGLDLSLEGATAGNVETGVGAYGNAANLHARLNF